MKNPFPRFNVTIIVAGVEEDGEEGAHVEIKMQDIKREDMMRPGYPAQYQALAKLLESMLE